MRKLQREDWDTVDSHMTKEINPVTAPCSVCHMEWPWHRGNCLNLAAELRAGRPVEVFD